MKNFIAMTFVVFVSTCAAPAYADGLPTIIMDPPKVVQTPTDCPEGFRWATRKTNWASSTGTAVCVPIHISNDDDATPAPVTPKPKPQPPITVPEYDDPCAQGGCGSKPHMIESERQRRINEIIKMINKKRHRKAVFNIGGGKLVVRLTP